MSGLHDPDVHDLALARSNPPRAYVSTNGELFWSDDRGETWTPIGVKSRWPLPYARGIAVKPDEPRVLFAGCGETTTGETGAVLRSDDGGQTWKSLPLPGRPNATMWGLATHPADPARIVAFTLFGEVYVERGRRRVVAQDRPRVRRDSRGGLAAGVTAPARRSSRDQRVPWPPTFPRRTSCVKVAVPRSGLWSSSWRGR